MGRKAAPYAFVCTRCHHLASRHYLNDDAESVHGPYSCTRRDCVCVIDQSTPLTGITQQAFAEHFEATLSEYGTDREAAPSE